MGTVLKALRESKKWSQEEVSTKLHMTQTNYSKLETGITRLTIERAKELADIFDIDPEAFLNENASIVNHNNGSDYKFVIQPQQYYEMQKEYMDEIIRLKDDKIDTISKELEKCHTEINRLLGIIENNK
jgi:transcriptional regulator with XRE-family HTH domain